MKFGHTFEQCLQQQHFPRAWVDHAIAYHQLKKCIHRLEAELAGLGLTPAALKQLLKDAEDRNRRSEAALASPVHTVLVDEDQESIEKPFEYILSTPEARAQKAVREAANKEKGRENEFHPKLLFTVDAATGEPLSAKLAPDTKAKLRRLALGGRITNVTELEKDAAINSSETSSETNSSQERVKTPEDVARDAPASSSEANLPQDQAQMSDEDPPRNLSTSSTGTSSSLREVRMVEVPLTSDSEFFSTLTNQLSGIADLQSQEEKKLYTDITELSQSISKIIETDPGKKFDIKDIVRWRKILNAYVDCNVFFETKPSIGKVKHDSTRAETQLQEFQKIITEQKLVKFKSKDSKSSANLFLRINHDLLQVIQFHELNNTAMTKILKKFDKLTALGVRSTFPKTVQIPAFTKDIAKAVCYQVNKDVLETVPRLSQYECPICTDIEWRPIRLDCGHVFCIRCLIRQQNDHKGKCPLCRASNVERACAANIDEDMAKYLKKWFPEEVKLKQKDNQYWAGVEEYGEAYKDRGCIVM